MAEKEYHPIYGYCMGLGNFARVFVRGRTKRVALLCGFDSQDEAEEAYAQWLAQAEAHK